MKSVNELVRFRTEALSGLRRMWEMRRVRRKLRRYPRPTSVRPHELPGRLVVSLTSYPSRYGQLHRTIRSLMMQTVDIDEVVLWISKGEESLLPQGIRALEGNGLTVATCENVRSYNKLIHTLERSPDAFVVTADDDLYYEPSWLETMTSAFDPADPMIICHRAHRLKHSGGLLSPYGDWEEDVQDEAARRPSIDLMPTGVAGILYPPHSLHPDVLDIASIKRLAPSADDLWFYWMARRAGTRHRKVGGKFVQILWPGTQKTALRNSNLIGDNDRQVRNLLEAFGDPTAFTFATARESAAE